MNSKHLKLPEGLAEDMEKKSEGIRKLMEGLEVAAEKAGESFRSLGVALTGVEALNHESVIDHIVIISGRGTGKQYALQKLLEQVEAGEATAPTPKKRKLYTDLGDWNECQPVEMNPYQDRLRHTQNNNWRGNGKRGKRKSR